MNYNDKIEPEQAFVLHTEEDQPYESGILKQSDFQNRLRLKSKMSGDGSSKAPTFRGKQNDCLNTASNNNKNIVTNHSFNGFFNQNTHKVKKSTNESISNKMQFSEFSQQSYQMNSPTNFNSTGKLSNLQFVGDSSKNFEFQQNMHSQVKSFMKKYFPDNYHSGDFYGKYVTLQHLVETLFDEFQNLIGKQNSFNLIEDFADKIFLMFGEKIFFEDLFQKTFQNGLTGLIFEVVKLIKEDQRENQQLKQNKKLLKPNQTIQTKNSFTNKSIANSNINSFKNQKNRQVLGCIGVNFQNQNQSRMIGQKISLDNFFGNSISRVQFHEDQKSTYQDDSTRVNEQNLDEIKMILEDYIESMYEEAQSKLNKKYAQQMKKITLKYKETQKLLEKVNEKISNHYDSIQLQKQYEKKLKQYAQKQSELQNKIKQLEYQVRTAKEEVQKEKLTTYKLDQECNKLKEKLQKYENAIFEKAMEKGSNQNSVSGSSVIRDVKTNSSIYSHQGVPVQQDHASQNPQRFQVKVDTFTEHRPMIVPLATTQTSYSPYLSRQTNGGLTPTRIRQIDRTSSVSPIKQRISFVKVQNPALNARMVSPLNDNSRITYLTNTTIGPNDQLKISTVQKVQVGQKIQLRPLSPIGKLNQIGSYNQNPIPNNNANISATSQINYAQRSYSPIKVQFCTSRVSTLPSQNR